MVTTYNGYSKKQYLSLKEKMDVESEKNTLKLKSLNLQGSNKTYKFKTNNKSLFGIGKF